jgi:hypothetical protein
MTALNLDVLAALQSEAQTALDQATTTAALEQWRVQYLGRKGQVSVLLRQVKEVPVTERTAVAGSHNGVSS